MFKLLKKLPRPMLSFLWGALLLGLAITATCVAMSIKPSDSSNACSTDGGYGYYFNNDLGLTTSPNNIADTGPVVPPSVLAQEQHCS